MTQANSLNSSRWKKLHARKVAAVQMLSQSSQAVLCFQGQGMTGKTVTNFEVLAT